MAPRKKLTTIGSSVPARRRNVVMSPHSRMSRSGQKAKMISLVGELSIPYE
jgi:hypothetical protein